MLGGHLMCTFGPLHTWTWLLAAAVHAIALATGARVTGWVLHDPEDPTSPPQPLATSSEFKDGQLHTQVSIGSSHSNFVFAYENGVYAYTKPARITANNGLSDLDVHIMYVDANKYNDALDFTEADIDKNTTVRKNNESELGKEFADQISPTYFGRNMIGHLVKLSFRNKSKNEFACVVKRYVNDDPILYKLILVHVVVSHNSGIQKHPSSNSTIEIITEPLHVTHVMRYREVGDKRNDLSGSTANFYRDDILVQSNCDSMLWDGWSPVIGLDDDSTDDSDADYRGDTTNGKGAPGLRALKSGYSKFKGRLLVTFPNVQMISRVRILANEPYYKENLQVTLVFREGGQTLISECVNGSSEMASNVSASTRWSPRALRHTYVCEPGVYNSLVVYTGKRSVSVHELTVYMVHNWQNAQEFARVFLLFLTIGVYFIAILGMFGVCWLNIANHRFGHFSYNDFNRFVKTRILVWESLPKPIVMDNVPLMFSFEFDPNSKSH